MSVVRGGLGGIVLVAALGAESVSAAITLQSPYGFHDVRNNSQIGGRALDDYFQVGIELVDDSGRFVDGATVTAVGSVPGSPDLELALSPCGGSFSCYFALPDFTLDHANATWTFQASKDGMNASFSSLAPWNNTGGQGIEALPPATNVEATNTVAPLVTWEAPQAVEDHVAGTSALNDGNVDRWRIRISDRSSGVQLFDSGTDLGLNISLGEDSYQVPDGFLGGPGDYRVEVMLEGFSPFSRARTRANFSVVPIPAAVLLFAPALGTLLLATRRRRRGVD